MTARILLVEDEAFIAMLLAEGLENVGFEIVGPCASVARALSVLDQPDCCDAAVLDANLRGESALPVAQALRARSIPFVVTTGYLQSQLPDALATATILSKPIRIAALVAELERLLSRR